MFSDCDIIFAIHSEIPAFVCLGHKADTLMIDKPFGFFDYFHLLPPSFRISKSFIHFWHNPQSLGLCLSWPIIFPQLRHLLNKNLLGLFCARIFLHLSQIPVSPKPKSIFMRVLQILHRIFYNLAHLFNKFISES